MSHSSKLEAMPAPKQQASIIKLLEAVVGLQAACAGIMIWLGLS